MNIKELFLMFILYSMLGWVIEVLSFIIEDKKLVNRGFLIGPCLPIYGFGGVFITLLLNRYYASPITLFVMAMFLCAILEYFTSFIMEKLFNARWWDYSRRKFNINGRICLETMIPFGLLGLVVIYLLTPSMKFLFGLLNPVVLNVIAIITLILFVLDILVSFKIISNFKTETKQFRNKDNTEEITKKVRETLSKKSPLSKRLVDAFPDFRTVLTNIKNELSKTKIELKSTKKDLKKTQKKLNKVEKKMKKLNKKDKKK